jgi:hypothetical protein
MMGIGAAIRMTCRCVVLPLADRISRREDAVIYRASLSNQAGSLALGLRDKSNNFAHIRSKHWKGLWRTNPPLDDVDHLISM